MKQNSTGRAKAPQTNECKRIGRVMKLSLLFLAVCMTSVFSARANSLSESTEMVAQQGKQVRGVVTDTNGEPVIGVNVLEKGTTNGAITDLDGRFSMKVGNKAVLQVSFIGYLPQEIAVGNKTSLSITLKEDTKVLDEVVVVGYGVQKKSDLTGAVSSVKMSDAPLGTFSTAAHALAGKAAGLRVTQNTAQPGAGASFRIRGETSINASNAPLFVVDGFPIMSSNAPGSGNRYDAGSQDNVMEMINPNDIESIEVLKDAAATSIYGSRAGHGVVIITTKRGASGAPKVTYSGNASVQTIAKKPELLDAASWMELNNAYGKEKWRKENGQGVYAGYMPVNNNPEAYTPKFSEKDIANAQTTDWMDEVTRTGYTQSHNISISGGTDKSKYLASLNIFDQKGVMKASNMQRYTANLNSDYTFNKMVKGGLSFNLSRNTYDNIALGNGSNEYSGVLAAAMIFEPNLPVRNENGDYSESITYNSRPNPVSLLEISDITTKDRVIGSGYLSIEPLKGLILKTTLGFDRKSANRKTYLPKTTLYGAQAGGQANRSANDQMDYLFNVTANYMKTIGKHSFSAVVGYEWQKFSEEWFSAGNTEFALDYFTFNNLGSGTGVKSVGSGGSYSALSSVFGRVNYSFADRYLLTATLRADGSSNFLPGNRWGYFPSVSAGWRFTEESFMQSLKPILSNGKLRVSYGQTGNASVGYRVNDFYTAGGKYVFGDSGTIGMQVSELGNPNLTWETTTEYNIGLDLGFLDNRINLTAEYYHRVISDLLVFNKRLPAYQEITSMAGNIGSTQSKGIELTLNTVNVKTKDWLWTTDFTFYKYKDTWKKRDPDWVPSVYEKKDDPIRAVFAFHSNGLLKVGEQAPAWQPGLLPGMIKLENVSDEDIDGQLTQYDRYLWGSADPDFSFGFNNTVRYKNWDLNIYMYGDVGRWTDMSYYEGFIPYNFQPSGTGMFQMSKLALKSWTMDNQNTDVPNIVGANGMDKGDYFFKKISYLRCRNITLGYSIPKIKNVVNNVRVSLSVNNPFVITNYKGQDPEMGTSWYSYPNVRTFSLGVDINF